MPRIEIFVLGPSSPEISTRAEWRVEAFGDVLETGVEAEKKSLEAFTSDQSGQAALVAKLDGVLAGTCLLVRSELEPCHPVSPWLAGLYVAPEHRRQGIGRALIESIEDHARRRGNRRLYLYTDTATHYYERLGWTGVDQLDWRGFLTTLMAREL
jgi:GNAT superfamily N-acetyltransferase